MARSPVLLALLFSVCSYAWEGGLTGIWMGEAPGRNGEKTDLALRFKTVNGVLTGVMFGEEFDLPLEGLKADGDRVSFSVTTTNYYSGTHATLSYTGSISANKLQLVRERPNGPATPSANERQNAKQTLTLHRIAP